ncbi:4'-phosphopantetheinyl transferase family protein [Pedobacter nutrimenti]|uniref:4'-phosphopantetheinyl transferase family protein n=1 Tax=Pedobacter nutrimenti TaxID=1241337 RepID=UPI002931A705|nr:4'-phosphopantetheinyl transferase superfamily protein [Pedobacter nutrimenti]
MYRALNNKNVTGKDQNKRIYIDFSECRAEESEAHFEAKMEQLPVRMQEEIRAYHSPQDRALKLGGRLLLKKMLEDLNQPHSLSAMQYGRYGRPFFDGDFQFNISHSGERVVCAAQIGGELGVDLEKVIPIDLKDYINYFTKEEWVKIYQGPDQNACFFSAWSKKEAFLKATGMGVQLPLDKVNAIGSHLSYEGRSFYFHQVDTGPEYPCWVASSIAFPEIVLKKR